MKTLAILLSIFVSSYTYAQETIDLFILAGQSNAQGKKSNPNEYPEDITNIDSEINFYWHNETWAGTHESGSTGLWVSMGLQDHVLSQYYETVSCNGTDQTQYFGPEVILSRKLKEVGYNTAIFKFTRPAAGIQDRWKLPGEGGLYDQMKDTLAKAIQLLEANGDVVRVRGLFWIQGSSDAGNESAANTYESNLQTIINDIRTEYSAPRLPVILGITETSGAEFIDEIIQAQANIALASDFTDTTKTMDLGPCPDDHNHLTSVAVNFQGERLFDEYMALTEADTLKYAFFGHTYLWGGGGVRVDERIENMDMSQFDRVWLGGDICSEASLDYSTLEYINSVYGIDQPGNHWTLGNHDSRNGNMEWIEEITGRPLYYAHYENNLTTIVLNGNISPLDCENLNKQYQMIQNVCDTINSGHLMILVHHGIYENVPGVANPGSYGHSQLANWMANCYDSPADYLHTIYPMLVEVENRGVHVMQIMGDVGANLKSYHGISDDGIEYFGSGINNSYNVYYNIPITDPDLILVFTHILSTDELSWEFVELNDL